MTAINVPFAHQQEFWLAGLVSDNNVVTSNETLSLERCVDWLLDLYQSTSEPVLRRLVSDVLTEVKELGELCDDHELEEVVLGALASVEAAFDVAC